MIHRSLLLSALLVLAVAASAQTTLYVSPSGSPSGPGTKDQPFDSPADALKAAQGGPATIRLREGTYYMNQSLVLQHVQGITLEAYPGETALLSGGRRLKSSGFTLVSDPAILNRLPAAARGHVYVFPLVRAGITDPGQEVQHGYKAFKTAPVELFYNKTPMTLSRYPNNQTLPIGTVSFAGDKPGPGARGATFACGDARLRTWAAAPDASGAWVGGMFSYGYSDDYLPVDHFDAGNGTITLKAPATYGVFATSDVSQGELQNGQPLRGFYVYNLLEELDSPGEYFVDRNTGYLYFWPPDGDLASADVEASAQTDPLVVIADSKNVKLEGLDIAYGRGLGVIVDNTQGTELDRCSVYDIGMLGITTRPQQNDHRLPYTRTPNTYSSGLTIRLCRVYNTGTGGIWMEGGDRVNLVAAQNIVTDCNIYNYSRRNRTWTPAVYLSGVGDKVTHCDIHDAPDQAVIFYGNDLTISYNKFENVTTHITDAGAVGTGRDIASQGDSINYNYFENIGSDVGTSVCAIYLDDGTSGVQVVQNVFRNCGSAGTYKFGAIHINGGTDNEFHDDYFLNCNQAFSNSPWPDAQWNKVVNDQGIASAFHPGVDIHSAAFQKKYPVMAKIANNIPAAQRQNRTYNIHTYNVGHLSSGAYVHSNTITANQDPVDWNSEPFSHIGPRRKK